MRSKESRNTSKPTLRKHYIRVIPKEEGERFLRPPERPKKVSDVASVCIKTHLPRGDFNKDNCVFRQERCVVRLGRKEKELRFNKPSFARKRTNFFRHRNEGEKVPPRPPARQHNPHEGIITPIAK
jgi:hypothetical protein